MRNLPAYLRAYKQSLNGRLCDCGRQAVAYNRSAFVCQTCIDLQDQDAYRRYTATAGKREFNPSRTGGSKLAERMWDGDLTGFAKTETAGWGPTEQFLQRLMAA